jgi:hypothetical protein
MQPSTDRPLSSATIFAIASFDMRVAPDVFCELSIAPFWGAGDGEALQSGAANNEACNPD